MLSAMVVLTALAMVGKLLWVDMLAILVIAGVAALLLCALFFKRVAFGELCRGFGKYVLTPGFACFALLAGFFLYATGPMVVWWGDDILQWAISPKSLWTHGGLVDQARHLSPAFAAYTPGIQVLQWWNMHMAGGWQEKWLYFTLFMSYAAFLLPVCSKLNWRSIWLAPIVIIAFPAWGNALSYVFLSVDTALSLCFGYALIQAWLARKGDAFHLFSLSLALCGLILIKQIGLLLAGMALLTFLVVSRSRKRTILCLLPPLAVWGGWMAFCSLMGLSGLHASGGMEKIAEMLQGVYVPPVGIEYLPGAFWSGLTGSIKDALLLDTSPALHVPRLLWLALFLASLWLLAWAWRSRELKRASLVLTGMLLCYLVIQYFGFYTVFYTETPLYATTQPDKMVPLMERYLAPFVLGMGMFALWLMLTAFPKRLAAIWKPLPWLCMAACAACLACTTNWGILAECLLPERYIQHNRSMGVETEVMMDHDWGTLLEGYENAYVLVDFEPNSDYLNNLQYVYTPARFGSAQGGFTQSQKALSEYLLERKVTHLICFEDSGAIIAPAQALMEDEDFYLWTLYEVQHMDGKVVLAEY